MNRIRPRLYLLFAAVLMHSGHTLAAITVIDSSARPVTLATPARRIVALAPHVVENVYSAGAGNRLVGVVSYSNYPGEATSLPQVGSAYAWSLESVIALQPDLVIVWGSGNGIRSARKLEVLGLNVYVSEPRRLEDISQNIRNIGRLAGTSERAGIEADRFDNTIRQLRNRYQALTTLNVFYQIWNRPLQTINNDHLISHVIELCGGRNIFGQLPQLAPHVSLEAVLREDPDTIVASGMDESRPEWLDDWRQYPSLKAVRHNALLHIHPDLIQRPTARIAQGASTLCENLDAERRKSSGRR